MTDNRLWWAIGKEVDDELGNYVHQFGEMYCGKLNYIFPDFSGNDKCNLDCLLEQLWAIREKLA